MEEGDLKRKIPQHVGLIMDGNRRWARERNLPIFEGHRRGYEKVKEACDWFFLRGVKTLSVYAFSTENWKREKTEVDGMMNLAGRVMTESLNDFAKKDYRVVFSGRVDELPNDLPQTFVSVSDKTRGNVSGTLNVCFNYGGRAELLDAVKKIVKHELTEEQIHEGIIKKYLYNPLLPDPDIIVRTGGEQRLSNFLLWQSAYCELLFMKKYWPDFEELDVVAIIDEYNSRQRRYGQ